MPLAARSLLQAEPGHFPASAAGPREPLALDSDVMAILAALLCALICVVGLAVAARCSFLRRYATPSSPAPNKGLKKKVIRALPRQTFVAGPATEEELADCPICLAEFADGDEIRILPHCGHGFHVGCVDTWLGAHSSCPSCRRILIAAPSPKADAAAASSSCCRHCGACSASSPAAAAEAGAKAREDSNGDRFLP